MIRIILILFFISIGLYSNVKKNKNILVIHSYHHGLEWTDSISEGIKSVFKDYPNVEIYFEYLDTKRNQSKKYYKKLLELYKEKSYHLKFDAIIVSDNAALNFVLEKGNEFIKDVPVVFCGINDFDQAILKGKTNISGIIEKADHQANFDLMFSIHKNINRLLIINDNTLTGKKIYNELKPLIEKYKNKINIEIISHFTLSGLQEEIIHLDKNDIIYLLVINKDIEGKFISYRDGIKKINEVSKNPIYGAWDFYLGKGLLGGKIISGFKHGKEAGLIVKKIINNQKITSDHKFYDIGSQYIFDYNQLTRFNINTDLLPKNSTIINKPISFIDKYSTQILIISLIIIIILFIRLYYKIQIEKSLKTLVNEKTKELIKTNKDLEKISITDSLTGLYNRGYLIKRFEEEIERNKRENGNLSLLMIDIDFFKSVNDTYGHQTGDIVLKEISTIFKHNLRENDVIGRYGGEEFLLILPSINLEKAKIIAEKIRLKVHQNSFTKYNLKISISGGVYQVYDYNIDHSIKIVDQLLYKAKDNGRNRIEFLD